MGPMVPESQADLLLCSVSGRRCPDTPEVGRPALKAENAVPKWPPKWHAHRGQHEAVPLK